VSRERPALFASVCETTDHLPCVQITALGAPLVPEVNSRSRVSDIATATSGIGAPANGASASA
jgi:hypothetical protein